MRRRVTSLFLPLLVLTLSGGFVPVPSAAQPSAVVSGNATAGDAGELRAQDLGTRIEALRSRLDTLRPGDETEAGVTRIEAGLAKLAPEIDRLVGMAQSELQTTASILIVEDIGRQLRIAVAPLADWSAMLKSEADKVAAAIDFATREQGSWTRARDSEEMKSAGVVDRIDDALSELSAFLASERAWQARLLRVDASLSERSASASVTLKKIESVSVRRNIAVLVPDEPPLWQPGLFARLPGELEQAPSLLSDMQRETVAYLVSDPRPFLLQALFAGVVGVLLSRFAKLRGRGRGEIAADETPALAMPWATAALLAVIATPLVHPLAPRRVLQWFMVLFVLASAVVLRRARNWGSPLFYAGVAGLIVGERVVLAVDSLPLLSRLGSMGVLLLCFATLRWSRSALSTPGADNTRIQHIVESATGLVVLAFVAEIGGWNTLSTLLRRSVDGGGLVALGLLALVLALDGLWPALLETRGLRRSHVMRRHARGLERSLRRLTRVAAVLVWCYLILLSNGLLPAVSAFGEELLEAGFRAGELSITVGGVLGFILTLVFVPMAVRAVTTVLDEEVYPRASLPRGMPLVLSTFVRYGLYAAGVVLALSAAGVGLSELAIMLGGIGVGVGLGLQDIVRNFVAGITILVERRIHVGDAVQVSGSGVNGRVLAISMRSTLVRNWDGAEVVVPNSVLVSDAVINWTLSDDRRRVEVPVTVDGDSDAARVIDALLEAARGNQLLLAEPAPSALFLGFDKDSMKFVLRAWTDIEYERTSRLVSDLGIAVRQRLEESRISLPQQDLQLVTPAGTPMPAATNLAPAGNR